MEVTTEDGEVLIINCRKYMDSTGRVGHNYILKITFPSNSKKAINLPNPTPNTFASLSAIHINQTNKTEDQ